jgi:8-oxo-dGTP pyrophosphatase MutT (NUDIX family)
MSLKPDLTVAALVERDGRFLCVQERVARRIVINQPAGHLEPGESLVAAVVREVREETCRDFTPDAVTGLYLWRAAQERTVLRVAFAGRVGEPRDGAALDRAILRTLWLDRRELAARDAEHRSPLVLVCIDDYLRGVRYPLEILTHVAAHRGPRAAAAV